jgi:RimJ/RimL family protein N-acetyltransferase
MRGQFITLRAVLPEDSDHYFRWINNKELVLNNGNYRPISKQEHDQWFSHIGLQEETLTFSIVENQNNQLIGSCSLRKINQVHQNAELQIRLGETDYHNKGLGTEAIRLLVQYGFSQLNLKRIYLYVFCSNQRAIRAYEKCSFSIEGTLRKAACIQGEFIDLYLMAALSFPAF